MSAAPQWPTALPTPLVKRRARVVPRSSVTVMDSRRPRVRRNFTTSIKILGVLWRFREDQYNSFLDFFENELVLGQGSFELITFQPHNVPGFLRRYIRECAFLDGTFQHVLTDGFVDVSAELEIVSETYAAHQPFYVVGVGGHVPFVVAGPNDYQVVYE